MYYSYNKDLLDERQSKTPYHLQTKDKFILYKTTFEFSKDIDVPKELWEYPIETRVRQKDRKDYLNLN